jgi:hypothetical protein
MGWKRNWERRRLNTCEGLSCRRLGLRSRSRRTLGRTPQLLLNPNLISRSAYNFVHVVTPVTPVCRCANNTDSCRHDAGETEVLCMTTAESNYYR